MSDFVDFQFDQPLDCSRYYHLAGNESVKNKVGIHCGHFALTRSLLGRYKCVVACRIDIRTLVLRCLESWHSEVNMLLIYFSFVQKI